MWTMAVVVPGVAAKDALEMPCIDDEEMIEALRSDGPDRPFRVDVRVLRLKRSLDDSGLFRSKDLVEARHVLRVTVSDEELHIDSLVDDVTGHVPRLLGDPVSIGVGGNTGNPESSAADIDEEKDVKTIKQHRVDGEEVCRHDVRCLGTEEGPPRRTASSRSSSEAVVLDDPSNRAGRKVDTELDQLALDTSVAPPGILPGQPHHKNRRVVVHLGASWSAVGVSPAPGHQLSMPGEQCRGRHPESPSMSGGARGSMPRAAPDPLVGT